jgi:hypothetical protein
MRVVNSVTIPLTDIGVLLVGYNRPDLLIKRIKELSKENIVNFYISIDGGEASQTREMEIFKEFAMNELESVPNLSITHEEKNLGLVKHMTTKISQVLSKHEYIIVIEDDVKVSKSFLVNMVSGLNYLKTKKKLGVVSGWSPVAIPLIRNKWRMGKYVYIWGWATSRSVWQLYQYDLSAENMILELENSSTWAKYSNLQQASWLSKFNKIKNNPFYTWDIQFFYHCLKNNYEILSPLFSMTGNEGFEDDRAVHP